MSGPSSKSSPLRSDIGDPGPPTADAAFDSLDKALKHIQIAEAWLLESIRHLDPQLGGDKQIDERYRNASDGFSSVRAQIRIIKLAQLRMTTPKL